MLNACGGSSPTEPANGGGDKAVSCDPPPLEPEWKDPVCGEEEICVVAGQNYDVGDIWVKANEDCLWIELDLDTGFSASETHVEVVLDPGDFPLTPKGSPMIGLFRYEAEECIDISDIDCDQWVYIAFHAVIWGEYDGVWGEETGWGCWEDEWLRSWGGYFKFWLPCCDDEKTEDDCKPLPTEDFCVKHIAHWGHHGYFDTLVYGNPDPLVDPYDWLEAGYPRYDGLWWVGWCADADTTLSLNYAYCIAPPLAIYCTLMDMTGHSDNRISETDWHAINWMLNNKGAYTIGFIQNAIWHFTNNRPENALAALAKANAPGWSPQPGDHVAYIIWVDERTQMTFIEVDP
jgi:hypothetical protein